MAPIRILTFSTLYPNGAMPRHGVFVEQRLRKLVATGEVESRVVAPVPWFPFKAAAFGPWGIFARVPREETRYGIDVQHPRFVRLPKIGMTLAPAAMAASALPVLRKHIADGYDFDLIDAHYFYPDGVAAVTMAQKLAKPVVVTARGTDLNLIPQYAGPRRMIQRAAAGADAMITVCQALKDSLLDLGVPGEDVTVLRNGVDLEFFRPQDPQAARQELLLGQDGRLLLSVGLLIDRKGHDIPIRALRDLPDVRLVIAGDGEKEQFLKSLAEQEGVADRVTFLGSVPHERLRVFFSAADALVLASSREGWANVLLESMACGTPVIASDVWGTPEVVARPEAGVLMAERTPQAFVDAYRRLMVDYPDRQATRRYAEGFSWEATTRGQLQLMRDVLKCRRDRP